MYTENKYRVVKSICNKLFSWLLTIQLIVILITTPVSVFAQNKTSMTDIRVGLKALYEDTSSIKINNNKIGLGYCIEDSYVCDVEFISSTGFTFMPETSYFYSIDKTYQTYKAAKSVADTMKALKVDAYPVSIYRNYWKVYIGGTIDSLELNKIYEKIEGRFSFTYTKVFSDNKHRIKVIGQNDIFLIDGGVKSAYPQFKALTSNSRGITVIDLGNRQYRGRIEIGRYGDSKITAVNIINIEVYLYSVVPCEMPGSWPFEALKTQALCARSFALSKVSYSADSSISRAYYIDDTTNSQVYKGYAYENTETTKAVDNTRGEVITYDGSIIPAYFFSTSGGSTEESYYVWGSTKPYLKSKADPYELEPEREPWVIKITKSQLLSKLNTNIMNLGSIKSVTANLITSSGRVYMLKVAGTNGTAVLQTNSIRNNLGLPSTKFKIIRYGDVPDIVSVKSSSSTDEVRISDSYILSASGIEKADSGIKQFIVKGADNMMNYPIEAPNDADTYYLAGMGYGHGVGMSQSGAKGMASAGFTYDEIIKYYYENCKISSIN